MTNNRIAIIAVAYNRIDSLKRLLDSLESAYYEKEQPTLIISIDKSNTDVVESFADSFHWPHGEKIVRKHQSNMGLRNHMMSLGEWFDSFETLVVLEDDIVVSPNFYLYTRQTSDMYFENTDIAGISLYSFAMNYQTHVPFVPQKNEFDVYLMNCAMSWGEVWMKPQWQKFYEWYLHHQNFPLLPHLPERICEWKKSWLKYHTRYCIEENKYFIHPYTSLSTNYGDAGTHNAGKGLNLFQVVIQDGIKHKYQLPLTIEEAVKYDGFFENKILYDVLKLGEEEVCIDICGMKGNRENRRYWLSTKIMNFRVIESYGLSCRPIEMNVIRKMPGDSIFLYDTSVREKNEISNNNLTLSYYTYQRDGIGFVNNYGWKLLYKEWFNNLLKRIKKHVFK